MCIDENEKLRTINRLAGENDVGMVAWQMTLMTPEYPDGRDVIVVANDLTHMSGSFTPAEDMLYYVCVYVGSVHNTCNSIQFIGIHALNNKLANGKRKHHV